MLGSVMMNVTLPPSLLFPSSSPPPTGVGLPPPGPPSIIPIFFPPSFGQGNHSTPRIFHGIGGDPVFTSGGASGNGKPCPDLNGRKIPSGMHYVPGPDECTLCVCEDGGPKWCKAVLCSPPTDCKSFRVGSSCCDFICLDDSLNKGSGGGEKTGGPFNGGPLDLADVVPKIIVVAITTILSMSLLLFLIHRLRQKQIQGRLNSAVARRCGGGGIGGVGGDDCEDGRSLDFSMDFFDRGPPPPHYLAWWKPPSSYFPPRGEAPPPYEEAIASTSNCLPTTFTSIYNNNMNNNMLVPPLALTATVDPSAVIPPSQSAAAGTDFSTRTQDCNGVRIATTCLTTATDAGVDPAGTVGVVNNIDAPNPTISSPEVSSSRRPFSKPRRFYSMGNSNSGSRGPSGGTNSNCGGNSRRSETEHLRRNGSHSSVGLGPLGSFLHQVTLPLGSSSSSTSTGGCSASTSVLVPLTYPPPYDYGEELGRHRQQPSIGSSSSAANPYVLGHSLTLPRHRTDYFGVGRCGMGGQGQGQDVRQQQRFSLQLNGGVGGGWSSASSSTLSLSTPNSPNNVIGSVGRPPSLSSSSSSNISGAHVQL